jgi:helicase MOV-10
MHILGRPHQRAAEQRGLSPDSAPEEVPLEAGEVHCDLCNLNVVQSRWARHISLPSHSRKERFAAFKAAFDEAEKDKHGVTVSHPGGGLEFGIVELRRARDGVDKHLIINNTVPNSRVTVVEAKIASTHLRYTSP